MPFEIQEVDIRLRVDAGVGVEAAEGSADTSHKDGCSGLSEVDREGIVLDCVRRVLRALDASNRR